VWNDFCRSLLVSGLAACLSAPLTRIVILLNICVLLLILSRPISFNLSNVMSFLVWFWYGSRFDGNVLFLPGCPCLFVVLWFYDGTVATFYTKRHNNLHNSQQSALTERSEHVEQLLSLMSTLSSSIIHVLCSVCRDKAAAVVLLESVTFLLCCVSLSVRIPP